jgi:peptidoglycan/LPS O-acetylase OafA/YrhL
MTRYAVTLILIALSTAFAVVRFAVGHRDPSLPGTYQALAHLFVGGLLGAWLVDRQGRRDCLYLALALSAVELLAFVVGRTSS